MLNWLPNNALVIQHMSYKSLAASSMITGVTEIAALGHGKLTREWNSGMVHAMCGNINSNGLILPKQG
jgi:hypothetical protein